jgi:hypothetical protein
VSHPAAAAAAFVLERAAVEPCRWVAAPEPVAGAVHCRCWVVGARQQGPEQNHGQGPEDHRSDAGRRMLHHRAHSRSGVICRRRWTDRRRADDGHGLDLVLQPLHVLDCLLQRRGVVGLQIINVVAHAADRRSMCQG